MKQWPSPKTAIGFAILFLFLSMAFLKNNRKVKHAVVTKEQTQTTLDFTSPRPDGERSSAPGMQGKHAPLQQISGRTARRQIG